MIRPATPADLPVLADLLRQLFAIETDFSSDGERQQRGLALLQGSPSARILVAEAAGAVVGMVTGQLVISTAEGGPSLLVEDLVVSPGCRRQGLGQALLREIAAWAESRGATRMQLLADHTNTAALNFYARLGWETTKMICLRRYLGPSEKDRKRPQPR